MTMAPVTLEEALQHHLAGDLPQAAEMYRQILEVDANQADAWHLFGALVHQMGRHDKAIQFIRTAIALDSSNAVYHSNLGEVYQVAGQADAAEACCRQALQLQPHYAEAHYNLGNALLQMGKAADSAVSFRQALRLKPDFAEAHNNLGIALMKQGQLGEAVACYRQALRLRPDNGRAHNNLGNALRDQGRLDEAAASFTQALKLQPDFAEAHNNLGNTLMDQGKLQSALAHFREALELQPGFACAHSNLLFCLNLDPQAVPAEVYAEHCRWGKLHAQASSPAPLHPNDPDPERRLRIGYVSPDFRKHPVAAFFEPILANHRAAHVEAYCYAELRVPDEVTARLQRLAHGWRWTHERSDAQLADLIRADGIDILVDLAGHTANNRLRVFARKPAPVQVTYLGYPNTTGLTSIDYRLTDAVLDPPSPSDVEVLYTEQLVRLPRGLCCFAPPPDAPAVAPVPALKTGSPVFGSLHRPEKMHAGVFDLWTRVLQAVPSARLLMYRHTLTGETREFIHRQFTERGIASARLELRHQADGGHLTVYRDIDILLDVFPWTGHAISCESLWMGVPVVSLAGGSCAGRLTASVLTSLELTELVARTPNDYVERAARLAGDLERLTHLRSRLRGMMSATLCDGARFTRDLEGVYRALWQKWCWQRRVAGSAPAAATSKPGGVTQAVKHRQAPQPPADAEALHRLGVTAYQQGRSETAIAYLEKAVACAPVNAVFHSNLAEVYRSAGKLTEAEASARRAVQLQPGLAEAHNNLALVLAEQGRLDEACAGYRQALVCRPDYAEALNNLGNALQGQGKREEATLNYRQALCLQPDFVLAHNNLGNVLKEQGQPLAAETCYREALRRQPGFASAHNNLGTVLHERGNLAEAEACFREALRHEPQHAQAHANLGNVLRDLGRLPEAVACYQHALRLRPNFAEAYYNLANAWLDQGRLDEATANYRHALRLKPHLAEAHSNLGVVFLQQGKLAEALACCQQALRTAYSSRVHSNLLFCLSHEPTADPAQVFAEHCRWGRLQQQQAAPLSPPANDRDPERRLRIGYVSPDFRQHAVARFFEPISANHDPAQVEVVCYAEVRVPDAVTARLRARAHAWRSTCGASDLQVAEWIRKDGIDILVDLAGHTANNRLRVFAYRPAPVQITYLGYANTTGLTTIDYKLTDAVLDPPDPPGTPGATSTRHTEELVRLPGGVCCFAAPADAPAVTPLPALRAGRLTFGSLHRLAKLNAGVFDLWCQVLNLLPSSRLLICRNTLTGEVKEAIRRQFIVRGIAADRLELRHEMPPGGHLAVYGEIDIALDVFPFAGGTTTCEALWMGVPVVAFNGTCHAGRGTASVLSCLGLRELVAQTAQQYMERTARLAGDLDRLARLRSQLRGMVSATLCDGKRFTSALETVYRSLWRKWCSQARPADPG